jgi:Tfp pilus assembly protein PilX
MNRMNRMTHMSHMTRNPARPVSFARGLPARQEGVVLAIALIVLVAMTLSALTLIRSVNLTNLVSGNLAFRESAALSAERSTERALQLIEDNAPTGLYQSKAGYRARREDPNPDPEIDGGLWSAFWDRVIEPSEGTRQSIRIPEDAGGNKVSYVIHRLCMKEGTPAVANCYKPPLVNDRNSQNIGDPPLPTESQVFYRITSKVTGPRNTVVYTQTIISL